MTKIAEFKRSLGFPLLLAGVALAGIAGCSDGDRRGTVDADDPSSLATTSEALSPVRGTPGDLWADITFGKADFGEIMPNRVTGNRLFNPGGVLVDRSVRPNRVYVYDANSRVLGFSRLGHVASGPNAGQPCTSNSDFPGSTCVIEEGRTADLVLGQPTLDRSACNGDGNLQNYPDRAPASASTLCSMPEFQISTTEGGSFANMAVDASGNLYVPDFDNNRVLLYLSPFTTDRVADEVWGQADFAGNQCNRGRGIGLPDAQSLCYRSPVNHGFVGGVGVDANGNLWVADNANHRVLRFSKDPATGRPKKVADLVLGQPNFTTANAGIGNNQMWAPAAVRVASNGRVWVADSQQGNNMAEPCFGACMGRVSFFDNPTASGANLSGTLNYDFSMPTGLELDPASGGIWVSDRVNNELLLFVNGSPQKVLFKDVPTPNMTCGGSYQGDGPLFTYEGNPGQQFDLSNLCDPAGSIGVDSDGNVLAAGSSFVQDVWRFPAPFPTPQPGIARSADARIFKPYQFGEFNSTTLGSLFSARGVAVANNQLIVADAGRLLFWNNAISSTNGRDADGVVGASTSRVQQDPHFGRIRQDSANRLWTLRGAEIHVYTLLLTSQQAPTRIIASPLPVLGGGTLSWDSGLSIGGIAPVGNGSFVWVADPDRHRVFRVRNPMTTPLVDVVLGSRPTQTPACNQGTSRGATTLCNPGSVVIDPSGNLWVSDHALEASGNHRLLEFNASLFPSAPTAPIYSVAANRVIGTGGSFTGECIAPLCGPWEPAFSPNGQMIVGFNPYVGGSRFPVLFQNPLVNDSNVALNDYSSMSYAAAFDTSGNYYVGDLNRGRVLALKTPLASGCASNPLTRVSATSSSNENASLGPANAIDGSMTTRWASAFSDPQWIYVDLGASRHVNRVVLNWEAASSRDYSIEVAQNTAGPWTTLYTDPAGNGGIDNILGLNGTGRYVRMFSRARNTAWGNSLWDFAIYGDNNPSCGTPATPVQLAIASSTSAGAFQTPPSHSHDNNTTTRYTNDGSLATASITYTLSASASVSKLRLLMYNGATRTYPIQIRVGSTVVFTGSTALNSSYWETTFPATTGSTVTVTMTAANSAGSNWFSIHEAQIYGNP